MKPINIYLFTDWWIWDLLIGVRIVKSLNYSGSNPRQNETKSSWSTVILDVDTFPS